LGIRVVVGDARGVGDLGVVEPGTWEGRDFGRVESGPERGIGMWGNQEWREAIRDREGNQECREAIRDAVYC